MEATRGGSTLLIVAVVVTAGCGGSATPRPPEVAPPAAGAGSSAAASAAAEEGPPPVDGAGLEGLDERYLSPFRACALGGDPPPGLAAEELVGRIEARAETDALAYSQVLRTDAKCLPLLEEGSAAYRALARGSSSARAELEVVADRVDAIRSSFAALARRLEGGDPRSDIGDQIMDFGKAYLGYEEATLRHEEAEQTTYRGKAAAYYRFIDCALGDVDYTSFLAGSDGTTAQDEVMGAIDTLCAQQRETFLARVELTCTRFFRPELAPPPDEAFERAVRHWLAQDGDYGSAVPVMECLAEDPPIGRRALAAEVVRILGTYEAALAATTD